MAENNTDDDNIDWSLGTWEGSRRESMRRWAQLPLEHIIAAIEEMEMTNAALAAARPVSQHRVQENPEPYTTDNKK